MLILTQPQEIIRPDPAGQTESLRAEVKPFAGHVQAFIIVISNAEMFFKVKVFPRVCEVVLRPGRDHASDITRTLRAFCVADTS